MLMVSDQKSPVKWYVKLLRGVAINATFYT